MEHISRPGRRADQVLAMLRSLDAVSDGGPVSELQHALQVATWAHRSGADDELVLAALVHDIGKVFGDEGHGEIAAGLLGPHVRSEVVEVVRHHPAFTRPALAGPRPGRPRSPRRLRRSQLVRARRHLRRRLGHAELRPRGASAGPRRPRAARPEARRRLLAGCGNSRVGARDRSRGAVDRGHARQACSADGDAHLVEH